ncbi:putative amidophosphoribosyltransferase [Friedmanniella endophytica]|uniref:Putative amidophosphoribosyltransferase n=1 Tax=Microlunatus kandeliicorticis TaxID=1759536 RepID=A0A7W3P6R8_9ACTN|nr:phosphoribosyltransferase family protein [Microlunatus kandeliicorticis]MBA8795331.1 putative amidophosphoribosyltransferase [Microlunatus kandeliicorticis]
MSGRAAGRLALESAADLLLGARCHGCGAPGLTVCGRCRDAVLARRPRPVLPEPCPDDFPLTVAAGPSDPVLRELISAHKDRQAWTLTGFLGDRLGDAVVRLLVLTGRLERAGTPTETPVVLVPVPSSAAAVRRRGRDATLALARRAARRASVATGGPVGARVLLRPARRLADQSGLDRVARAANVRGAFRTAGRWRLGPLDLSALTGRGLDAGRYAGTPVVVVDDLVTTGASLLEAARTLERAGLPVLGAATVAATRRRSPSRPAAASVNLLSVRRPGTPRLAFPGGGG